MKQYKMSSLIGMFLIVLLTFMLSACSPSQNTGASGTPTATHGDTPTPTPLLLNPTSPIKALRMLDHAHGWALTDQNILVTTDGGQIWKDVTPSGSAYGKYAVGDFMNTNYAWIVSTAKGIDNSVSVLRTSDGGAHWQSSTISVSGGVALMDPPHFLTTQEGFLEVNIGGGAAGSEGMGIFHTTDGGQNWTEVAGYGVPNTSFPLGGRKTGISFKDVQNGWATGYDYSYAPWLYVTHDGGHTWSKQSIPPVDTTTQYGYTLTPPVFIGNTGFLPAIVMNMSNGSTSDMLYIYKTTDGGTTWTVIHPQHAIGESIGSGLTSTDLYIADLNHGWVTDATGQVWGTSDGFNNWQLLNSQVAGGANSDANITAFSFVDGSYGWAITKTKLLHTTDGGKTWSEIVYHLIA